MPDTIAGNRSTTATIGSYNSVYGAIDFGGDADWYKASLFSGWGYQVWVEGARFGEGTLTDPYLTLYNGDGWAVADSDDYTHYLYGTVLDSYVYFAPTVSGSYFVAASSASAYATGTYRAMVTWDELASASSAATASVRNYVLSDLGRGTDSSDWFRVSLVAGTTYQFDLAGSAKDGAAAGLTMGDPLLVLRDAAGTQLMADDHSGLGMNARITYTATRTGTYFLDVQESVPGHDLATYQLTLNDAPASGSLTLGAVTAGGIEFKGDVDEYAITLRAGQPYRISVVGDSLHNPFVEVLDAQRATLASDDDSGAGNAAMLTYIPSTTGTFYVEARASGNRDTGTYSVIVSEAPTAQQLFLARGDASWTAGNLRTMADFAKAAYSVQSWETPLWNEASASADQALSDLLKTGWTPVTLAPAFPSTTTGDFTNRSAEGFYTNDNAAAFIARSADALVIAFRGTNDLSSFGPDAQDDATLNFNGHYDLLRPLVAAIERFVDDPASGISRIYVTGHSLGGAMAIKFMDDHPSYAYEAATFAAPSYQFNESFDQRMTLVAVKGDVVAQAREEEGFFIEFATDIPILNPVNLHSMDLYQRITESVDGEGWNTIYSRWHDWGSASVRIEGQRIAGANGAFAYVVDGGSTNTAVAPDTAGDGSLTQAGVPDYYDIFYGGKGVDRITGGSVGETLLGGPGNDSLSGRGGKDFLVGGAGDDALDGGDGLDTGAYAAARSGYLISKIASGFAVSGPEGTDTLVNVERLRFTDVNVALDIDGIGGQAYRLYQAAFNRVPDGGGLGYWINVLDDGASLRDVSLGFVGSDEFKSVYGASPTNAQLVAKYYQNVLHREPEAGGYLYWVGILDLHLDTPAGVLASISESGENQAGVIGVIGNGFSYTPFYD